MKQFFSPKHRRRNRRGFSLVEAALSIGIMSFGILSLAPLLALGLNDARLAHENRTAAQIAASLMEQAKQGPLPGGTLYFDSVCSPTTSAQAAFSVRETITPFAPGSVISGPLSRLILTVSPIGSPNAPRFYADVFPTP